MRYGTLARARFCSHMKIDRRQFNYGLVVSLGLIPFRPFTSQAALRVNGKRIMDHILALAEFGKNPQGGVSRVAYSDADKQGREYVLGLMRAAKLDVTIDAAGNMIGRRAGSFPTGATTVFQPLYSSRRRRPC